MICVCVYVCIYNKTVTPIHIYMHIHRRRAELKRLLWRGTYVHTYVHTYTQKLMHAHTQIQEKKLEVKMAPEGGTYVPNLAVVAVHSMKDVMAVCKFLCMYVHVYVCMYVLNLALVTA